MCARTASPLDSPGQLCIIIGMSCQIPYCSRCNENWFYLGDHPEHDYYHWRDDTQTKELVMAFIKRRDTTSKDGSRSSREDPPAEMNKFPALWEFLEMDKWAEDGKARIPGTVLLFTEVGRLKAMFNDKDGGYVAFASLDVSVGVLDALDDLLRGGALDWRKSKAFRK